MAHIPPVEALRGPLMENLRQIEYTGKFAASDQLKDFVDPGLFVPGVGSVKLPVEEGTAQALIKACHQAPFGKAEETIIDTSVRKTWELNSDQFELRNPQWTSYINDITARAISELGFISNNVDAVQAELYKLLIYEKGAMFKLHKDSEKAPGMFGTLVISLPSAHEGGWVQLRHANEYRTFRSDQHPASYACWYSDVSHEVTPVTEGYRFVLTFNLTADSRGTLPSAKLNYTGCDELHELLTKMQSAMALSTSSLDSKLIHRLEHKYTEHHLGLQCLKGKDLSVARALQDACSATGFLCFLASCEKMVYGGCDEEYNDPYDRYDDYSGWDGEDSEEDSEKDSDDSSDEEDSPKKVPDGDWHIITEEIDSSLQLKTVVDMAGRVLAENLDVDEYNFLLDDPFCDGPDEEDYSGFTGNEGVNATHWYRDTVIVLVPSTDVADFLIPAKSWRKPSPRSLYPYLSSPAPTPEYKAEELLQYFHGLVKAEPANVDYVDSLKHICRKILDTSQAILPSAVVHHAITIADYLGDAALLDQALISCQGHMEGLSGSIIGQHLANVDLNHFIAVLTNPIFLLKKLAERISFIVTVGNCLPEESPNQIEQDLLAKKSWMASTLDEILQVPEVLEADDVKALFNMMNLNWSPQPFLDRLDGIVLRNHGQTIFMINFLSALCPNGIGVRSGLPQDRAISLFRDHFAEFCARFDIPKTLEKLDQDAKSSFAAEKSYYHHYAGVRRVEESDSEAWKVVSGASAPLTSLVREALRLGMEDEAKALISAIRQAAETYNPKYFKHLFLPFLRSLVRVWMENREALADSAMDSSNVYQAVLAAYSQRVVGQKPPPQKDWSRKPVSCSCGDCVTLNAFIVSRTERVGRFAVNKSRRHHLHLVLERFGSSYKHETERRGSPQTLVVTKTQSELDQKKHAWRTRHAEAANELKAFGLTTLREILGDRFDEIAAMDGMPEKERSGKRRKMESGTKAGHDQRQFLASSSHAENIGAPIAEVGGAGTKRKIRTHEIIDLTDE